MKCVAIPAASESLDNESYFPASFYVSQFRMRFLDVGYKSRGEFEVNIFYPWPGCYQRD